MQAPSKRSNRTGVPSTSSNRKSSSRQKDHQRKDRIDLIEEAVDESLLDEGSSTGDGGGGDSVNQRTSESDPFRTRYRRGDVVFGQFDFSSRTREELSFDRGDQLFVYGRLKGERHWYFVVHGRTGKVGLVPDNYFSKDRPKASTISRRHNANPHKQQTHRIETHSVDIHLSESPLPTTNSRKMVDYEDNRLKAVTLHDMPWFHGVLSRIQCEEKLISKSRHAPGYFMLRMGETYKNEMVLGVTDQSGSVQHYRISFDGPLCKLVTTDKFNTIKELLQKYKKGNGICSPLNNAIHKGGSRYFYVNPDEFVSNQWSLTESMLEKNQLIAEGEFGEIWKGIYNEMPVAIKEVKSCYSNEPPHNADEEQWRIKCHPPWFRFFDEAACMTHIGYHPNIVRLLGIIIPKIEQVERGHDHRDHDHRDHDRRDHDRRDHDRGNHNVKLVLEYIDGVNLLQYVRSKTKRDVDYLEFLGYVRDVAAAMAHVHQRSFVHGDLAARNVLIGPDSRHSNRTLLAWDHRPGGTSSGNNPSNRYVAKLCDFGHAHRLNLFSVSGAISQPVRWSAPEVLESPEQVSQASDVWSFGVLLYEVFSRGKTLYRDTGAEDLKNDVVNRGVRLQPVAGENWPKIVGELMHRCFQKDPNNRATFSDIHSSLQHAIKSAPLDPNGSRSVAL